VLDPERLERTHARYPDAGTLRVHPTPESLLPADPEMPGENRFDDPDGHVAVRYTASQLITCLKETMARLRPNEDAEGRLAVIEGVEDGDIDRERGDSSAVGDW
jgi:hypothetical protein